MTSDPAAQRTPPQRLLFVRTDRLGETLLTLPTLRALREAWPACRLILCVQPALAELLRPHPDAQELHAEPEPDAAWWQRAWRLGRRWRAWQADAVLIANPKKEYHAAAWLAGIPRRVGYDRKWGGLLTDRLDDRKALGDRHEVQYNLDLLSALGVAIPRVPEVRLLVDPDVDQDMARRLERLPRSRRLGSEEWLPRRLAGLTSDHLLAVHPWASTPTKCWPASRFRALMRRLHTERHVRLLLVGGREHQHEAKELARDLPGVTDWTGQLSLPQLAGCLRHVRLLVSNDSGPMHVAAAVGTPTIALFGTTDPAAGPRRWGPWGQGHSVIHQPSMDAISVQDVFQSTTHSLSQSVR